MLKQIMAALEEESEESVVDVTNKIEAIESVRTQQQTKSVLTLFSQRRVHDLGDLIY